MTPSLKAPHKALDVLNPWMYCLYDVKSIFTSSAMTLFKLNMVKNRNRLVFHRTFNLDFFNIFHLHFFFELLEGIQPEILRLNTFYKVDWSAINIISIIQCIAWCWKNPYQITNYIQCYRSILHRIEQPIMRQQYWWCLNNQHQHFFRWTHLLLVSRHNVARWAGHQRYW